MTIDTEHLDYLTVDSIQWATGHVRPRMALEDKRAKHRVHQRDFVSRQRQRLEELRRELRCHKLHLLRLQAIQEVTALAKENDTIRQQLIPDSFSVEPTDPSSPTVMSDACSTALPCLPLEEDHSAILELLDLLPVINSTDVVFDDICPFPLCKGQEQLSPLAWSPTAPCGIVMVESFV